MKKYLWLSVLIISILPFQSFGQLSFSNSLGGGLYINNSSGGFAAVYSPRLNFINFRDNATISLGTHLGLGFNTGVSSQVSSGGGSSLILDIPLVLELNVGHACNSDNTNNFGFFIGFGAGYNSIPYVDDEGNVDTYTLGVVLNAGIRGNISGASLEGRFEYLVDASGLSSGVLGFDVAYTFGIEKGYY